VDEAPGVDDAQRERLRARFGREARSSAALHHPNVVTVHDFGTDPELGLDFLVMELLEGEDLAARMARGERPDPGEAIRILREAARGLAAGHRLGLVHRDVKPGNLFRCVDEPGSPGRVVLLDFGIAHPQADDGDTRTALTAFGQAPHSPGYAAPEQLRGEAATPASDVYSLCAVAFELLVGRRPFQPADTERRVAGELPELEPAEAAGLPFGLAQVLRRGLSPVAADRYLDAGALLNGLDEPLAEDATLAGWSVPGGALERRASRTVALPGRGVERRARRWVLLAAGGLTAMAAAVVALPSVAPAVANGLAARFTAYAAMPDPTLPSVRVVPPPHARWEVAPVSLDSRCGDIFDVCRRVQCSVANAGNAYGATGVEAQITGPSTHRRSPGVISTPSERRMMVFEFREAEAGERFTEYSCRAIPIQEVAPDPDEGLGEITPVFPQEFDGEAEPTP
jgi:serine/threonine protein kinase